jgi:hypothetical protein
VQIDWVEYGRVHTSRTNLLIHIIAVPLFIAAFVSLIKYVVRSEWTAAAILVVIAVFAMALQGRGHKKEPNPPRPFSGPLNFLRRWFTEQFFIFPAFVLSGRWWRHYMAATVRDES